MSLKNVCFENIKDEFYYGKFGEFTLVIDKNTGFFNATKLCKQSKKQYSHWFSNKRTTNLITEMKSCPRNSEGNFSYENKGISNNSKIGKIISGTYLCKELILDLASWISPEFYLKCNDIILNYFEREYQSTIKEKDDKIDILINQNTNLIKKVETVEVQNNNLLQQNILALKRLEELGITLQDTNEQLEDIQETLIETNEQLEQTNIKLDKALPDRNVNPSNETLTHQYILFKSKLDDNEYVFIRGQDKYIKNKKNLYKTRFEITLDQKGNPNPIDLVNRLKEKIQYINEQEYTNIIDTFKSSEEYKSLSAADKRRRILKLKKENSKIIYRINKIFLKDFSEELLLELINDLEEEKYKV